MSVESSRAVNDASCVVDGSIVHACWKRFGMSAGSASDVVPVASSHAWVAEMRSAEYVVAVWLTRSSDTLVCAGRSPHVAVAPEIWTPEIVGMSAKRACEPSNHVSTVRVN